jgi:hypothetical protein
MNKAMMLCALLGTVAMVAACNRQSAANDSANAAAANDSSQAAAAGGDQQASAEREAELRALLDRIYAPYAADDARDIDIASYMEPQLAKAMAEREEGVDADPFIDAQDYAPFRPTYEAVRVDGDRAEATASFNNMGNQTRVTYQFVRTGDGWKIADIRSAEGGSFRSQYDLPALK